jgi:hypothetical protein
MRNFWWTHFCEKQKIRTWRSVASWKFALLFTEDHSWTLALRQVKFGTGNILNVPTSLNIIIILFDEAFKYSDCVKFWEVFSGQMLTHCVYNYMIFAMVISCKVKYLTYFLSIGLCVLLHNFLTEWLKFVTALLNNVRKVCGLVLSRTACLKLGLYGLKCFKLFLHLKMVFLFSWSEGRFWWLR